MPNLISNPNDHSFTPITKVIGVGGAGNNAVANMISYGLEGVEFVVANTDAQTLGLSPCSNRIQMGNSITSGLGAGSSPEVGFNAAQESIDQITEIIQGSNIIFITAGMGGGTGTGAAPLIAKVAKDMGIITVAVITKPFKFEGQERTRIAEEGIINLKKYVDTLIVVANQNLFRVATPETGFTEAFRMADNVLYNGVKCITDLFLMPGLINLDLADVATIIANNDGMALMGVGEASGSERAEQAASNAINNPLLEDLSINNATGILINITGGPDMTLFEVDEVVQKITKDVDPKVKMIFGAIFNEEMEGSIRVSVVATGVSPEKSNRLNKSNEHNIAQISSRIEKGESKEKTTQSTNENYNAFTENKKTTTIQKQEKGGDLEDDFISMIEGFNVVKTTEIETPPSLNENLSFQTKNVKITETKRTSSSNEIPSFQINNEQDFNQGQQQKGSSETNMPSNNSYSDHRNAEHKIQINAHEPTEKNYKKYYSLDDNNESDSEDESMGFFSKVAKTFKAKKKNYDDSFDEDDYEKKNH